MTNRADPPRTILSGAAIFDGTTLRSGHALVIEGGRIVAILPEGAVPEGARIILPGGTLAPGFIDLQVNGGGGLMVDGSTDVAALRAICAAHIGLGATGILPTLITDTPEATASVIAAGIAATAAQVPGFLGLHLEGPHLDPRRKGAHDPALIRRMEPADLARLCDAARALPALIVTVSPASVTPEQIATLTAAGAIVSIGHSEATEAEARGAFLAGARCVTHLFNAMSQLGNREPGLVGATLDSAVAAGLIADGLHVAPSTLRVALTARPGGLFLVSDAMAVAGTDLTEFTLGNRRILRKDGRLVLEDGTLAGADLSLPRAVQVLIQSVGAAPERALAMASTIPAQLIGAASRLGSLSIGAEADLVHFDQDWTLTGVWKGGAKFR
ncbi:MAG: N-acetylglucosamine-6-phosphate deacetylase [Paracoccaceae bacterium]|nr:N-acetylglucosamine-6-phosphate deacetylase [Paracoccaceae bacterium]